MNRRDFVKLGTPPGKQLGTGGILDAGVDEQQRLMEAGKLTSHWLTSQYLTRIKLAAKPGIEIYSHALKTALDMDRERNLKRVCGPLHGIPVLLKEGSEVAGVQLRAAGAVIIGKIKHDQLDALTLSSILGVERHDPIMQEHHAGIQNALLDLKSRGALLVDKAISVLVFQHVAESGLDAHRVQVPDDLFQRSILQ
ncbi:amidase family protein [Duganella flavida]|uniref:amidase family protein n=1 Tax=Duganella flavida TaxID=2692175 RepID=UPI001E42EFBB|nr:amidase family protein [Duganella flavida]